MVVEHNVEARMRDGTVLRADIYRPADFRPAPVLLQRTCYGKEFYSAVGQSFAAQGFVTVLQDVRGQFASDGVFEPWINEGDDGFDTIEWAALLPGVTGKVGTFGSSYAGACQWQAALRKPPHLAAMLCQVTPADYYDQWVFPGGAFALSFNETWLMNNVAASAAQKLQDGERIRAVMSAAYQGDILAHYRHIPLRSFGPLFPERPEVAGYYFDWINKHATRDDYWRSLSVRGRHCEVEIPVLNFGGWYDVFINGTIENFLSMQNSGGSKVARNASALVIGPWAHLNWSTVLGDVDFGPAAASPYPQMARVFFDRWLKDIALETVPAPVQYFVMGIQTWKAAEKWPPAETLLQKFYLASDGKANSLTGDGRLADMPSAREGSDRFVYDPADPVPSLGGNGCCYAPQSPFGPYDQRPIEGRADMLVYSSEPLVERVEIAGPVALELYAASSAPDTDFTAKLVDVHPNGRAINLCQGIVRARFREGAERPVATQLFQVHRYEVTLTQTANVFLEGHRIRLEVSSSNFPLYDRNPNTGGPFGQSAEIRTAEQTILHGPQYPSALILPVQRDRAGEA